MTGDSKTWISSYVNDEHHDVPVATNRTPLEVLREDLRVTGTNHGRELGECGTHAVLVEGEPTLSRLTLAREVAGREITTEGGYP